jgi:hypothetical protein
VGRSARWSTSAAAAWLAAALLAVAGPGAASAQVSSGTQGRAGTTTASLPRLADAAVQDADRARASAAPTHASGAGTYIVTLTERPAASYAGGVDGLKATRPGRGERFDRTRAEVAAYARHLRSRQDALLDRVGNPTVLYRYTTALNGFAAELDAEQVEQVRDADGVALVERSSKQRVDTTDSPDFLGLPETWDRLGGRSGAGRGTVIGVVDTGIWPENPAFSGLPQQRPGAAQGLPRFHGACAAAAQWAPDDCNDKIVSARYFVRGFGADAVARSDFLSARDGSGHGSHVAATAAGNDEVRVKVEGQTFGDASGMAPGARLAAYKACWAAPDPEDDGCTTPDAVAAIDRAVADGVDVISYAASGTHQTVADSVGLAFLHASAAGVFVATSGGNDGPGAGSVKHAAPWVTTVAASTHRPRQGAAVVGGQEYVGAMVSDRRVSRTGLVRGADVAAPGASVAAARICEIGALDSRRVQGRIVLCQRGTTARVDKSAAVEQAGGVGMILANATPDSLDADFHAVPTVHVDVVAARRINAYIDATDEPTAVLDPTASGAAEVPQVAEFSGRGPSSATDGDVLKPDLTAPGVGVVAAVAPPSGSDRLWDLASGTSVSTAHVAGLAALVASEKPTWSPAAIKSAMMTTAFDVEGPVRPFSQGAGHVDPTRFLDPGLVLDTDLGEYTSFLAGQGFAAADGSEVADTPIDGSDLNLPSIAVGDLTGRVRVKRRVTNVSATTEAYAARVTGLDGIRASAEPRTLELAPGESATLTITFQVAPTATFGSYARGELVLTGLTHDVRVPVALRPQRVSAAPEVTGSGATGSVEVRGVSGSHDPVDLQPLGLVGASPVGITLEPGPFDTADPEADADTERFPVRVPSGTDLTRFEVDGHNSGDDLDLYVYRGDELVAQSAQDSPGETITLLDPEPGEYVVYVSSSDAANGSTTTAQFYSWVVSGSDARNVALGQRQVDVGVNAPFGFRLSWSDLPATSRWFGAVEYVGTGERTLVTVG